MLATIRALGSPQIAPVDAPPTRIAPDGAVVAADGSWTLDGATHQFGRFAPDTGEKLWLEGEVFIGHPDIRDASAEQLAAIAALETAFEPSLRVWYGLDPRTTSDDHNAAAIRAVILAVRRTSMLRNWSVTADEVSFVPRPGPQREHAVYAVRERRRRIVLSSAATRNPSIRRVHTPGRSWQYDARQRCWYGYRDVGPPPLPVAERALVRYGRPACRSSVSGSSGSTR